MKLEKAMDTYDYAQLESQPEMNLTKEQLENMTDELKTYHEIYSPYFTTEARKTNGYNYLHGLLNPEIHRKTSENIALATTGPKNVRSMQNFIGQSKWSCDPILAEHHRQTATWLGDSNGILAIDGSDMPKQGRDSIGVQRQYCGQLGKTANCQAGVFLGYSSPKGYTLLDRRLYVPEVWFTPEYTEKRYKAEIPITLEFKTKNQLAWNMIEATSKVLPARWLTMDEAFGRDGQLLDKIADDTSYLYFAEVPKDTRLWLKRPDTYIPEYKGVGRRPTKLRLCPGQPSSLTIESIIDSLSQDDFTRHSLKDGTKGLIVADIATLRVIDSRDGLPHSDVWLTVRRHPTNPSDIRYYLSNAPADTPPDELVSVCVARWIIETMFQQAKQHLGMNEYQTRSWDGWHHHMTLVILAFGFLARFSSLLKDDAPALTLPQTVELLSALLPLPRFDIDAALERLRFKQHRIHVAKRSHFHMQRTRLHSIINDSQ